MGGMWGSTLEEGPGAGMLSRILEGEVRDKMESTGNRRKCRKKSKYGNVERDTSKTTLKTHDENHLEGNGN